MGAFERIGGDLRQPVAADFALDLKALHGIRQILGGHGGVVAVSVEQRHMVHPQAAQRAVQLGPQMRRRVVDPPISPLNEGSLGGDVRPVPARGQPLADHRFADAAAVNVCHVKEIYPVVPGGIQRAKGLGLGRGTKDAAERQAAKANGRDEGAIRPKVALFHVVM